MISNETAGYVLLFCAIFGGFGLIISIVSAFAKKDKACYIGMTMFVASIVVVIGIVSIMQNQQKKSERETAETTVGQTEPTVDLSVSYDDIYNAYKENELVANDLYRYNRYRITAEINGMSTGGLLNLTGGATLTMERRVGNTIVFFYAEFEKEQEDALKQVKVGDTITFDGKCIGKGGFAECELIPEA